MIEKVVEHEDLEERFQISAEVEFSSAKKEFDGMKPMEVKIKKKEEPKTIVKNVKLRESTGGLF